MNPFFDLVLSSFVTVGLASIDGLTLMRMGNTAVRRASAVSGRRAIKGCCKFDTTGKSTSVYQNCVKPPDEKYSALQNHGPVV